jgi:hypothetical protein
VEPPSFRGKTAPSSSVVLVALFSFSGENGENVLAMTAMSDNQHRQGSRFDKRSNPPHLFTTQE